MANEKTNSPRENAVAVLAKAQKLLNKKTSPSMDEVKTDDLKKSAEFTSGLHTVEYHGLESSKYSPQQAALAVLAKAQDMLSEATPIRSEGLQKSASAESGMHKVEYYSLAKKEMPEEIEHLCDDHMVKKDGDAPKGVSKAECAKCVGGMQKSEFTELYEDLSKMEKALGGVGTPAVPTSSPDGGFGAVIARSEGKDENEIGTKFVKGEGTENKKAPSNDMKPRIEEKPIERDNKDFETKPGHAPENDHREEPQHPTPAANPAAHGQGSNPPAGSTPGGATPGTGKKGVHKLSFFMGHCHSKKNMKKGIALG